PGGQNRFLENELDRIGKRLKKPERTNDVRPLADLHRADHAPLRIGQVSDREEQRRQDRADLAENDQRRPSVCGPEISHGYRWRQSFCYRRPESPCISPW